MSTAAQGLLDRGLASLASQFPEPFTVEGFANVFTGLIEETRHGNTLGVGGFLADADAILCVARAEFAPVALKPFPGMRVTIMEREFLVTSIGTNAHKWTLVMEQASPKPSDVP